MSPRRGRNLVVDGVAYQWDVRGRHHAGWSPEKLRLLVWTPSSLFETTLYSKNWDYTYVDDPRDHPTHWAVFRPRDVVRCIRAALTAGWSPLRRSKAPFVLSAPPECEDYGPKETPKNKHRPLYGRCPHGSDRAFCSDCSYWREQDKRYAERMAAERAFRAVPESTEFCLGCFKRHSSLLCSEILGGKMPDRFCTSPWRLVTYWYRGHEGYGVVCGPECETLFYSRVRRETLTDYFARLGVDRGSGVNDPNQRLLAT